MASSQTSSHSQKRDQIIDGRLFSRSSILDKIRSETKDIDSMERIISKLEEQCLYRLGHSHTDMYDEQIVEEFYHDASVKVFSREASLSVLLYQLLMKNLPALCRKRNESLCRTRRQLRDSMNKNQLLFPCLQNPKKFLILMHHRQSVAPDSPRTEARKEHLNSLGRQTVFVQEAVDSLYQVGKEMDWLNLTASEDISSVGIKLNKIAEVFRSLPQDLKEAFANFQQLEEQSLLEEQSKLRIVESKTIVVLEYTDSRISDHDVKIHDMAKFINSLDEKLSKFEEQGDNILKVLRSIDHTVSELNAKKGEGNPDANREPAHRSSDQDSQSRHSEHESIRRSSSRLEHQHRY
ncbi:hypothetical protein OROMI_019163 [Orobanche minor]